jgi:UrcA family protein
LEEIIMKALIATTKRARLLAATILGSLAMAGPPAVLAADNGGIPQSAVKFADLSPSAHDGAAALYNRIHAAAYDVCRSFDMDRYGQSDLTRVTACVHDAVRNAVAKVNQPALYAVYNARNRDPLPITVAAATQNR